MRDLFTYPNNPSTYYIDPTYYGDNDAGWVKRMNHYLGLNPDNSGNSYYIGGVKFTSDTTLASASTFIGKYFNYVDNKGQNFLSRYGWSSPNWVEGEWQEEKFEISEARLKRDNMSDATYKYTITVPQITGTKWGSSHYHTFADSDSVYIDDLVPDLISPADSSATEYFVQESTTTPGKFTVSTSSSSVVNPGTTASTRTRAMTAGDLLHRQGSGSRMRFASVHNLETGDRIRFNATTGSGDFFTSVDSGDTVHQHDVDLYVTKVSEYSIDLFTDSARTTGATLTEHYEHTTGDRGVFTFTNSSTTDNLEVNLTGIDISSQSATFKDVVNNQRTHGWCRVYFSNTTGTITEDNVDCAVPIDTSLQYSNIFYYRKTDTDEIKILESRSQDPEIVADFELGPSSSTDVNIMLIDPSEEIASRLVNVELMERVLTHSTAYVSTYDQTGDADYYLYDAKIIQKGNVRFRYDEDDGSGNAQQTSGAVLADDYWNPGSDTSTTYASGEKPGITVSLDASTDRFDDLTITSGGSMPYSKVSTTNYDKKAIYFVTEASDFIPSSTALELEEQHALDNDWDGSVDFDGTRIWPQHIKPTNASLTTVQPSSVVRSQNGTKYVRTSGVTKYQIKLDYGLMTYDDYKEFQRVVQGAQGQVVPFYLNLIYSDGTRLLFRNNTDASVTVVPRLGAPQQSAATSGTEPLATDTTILYDGFPNNYTEINAGDLVISGSYPNGNLRMVMNNPVANIFGEAIVQFDRPWGQTGTFHSPLYADPTHIIVTLADDAFDVNKSINGLYSFSITFDADEFKG